MRTASTSILVLSLTAVLLADQVLKGFVLAGLPSGHAVALGFVRIRVVRSDHIVAGRLGIRPALLWCAWMGSLFTVQFLAPRVGLFETPLSQAALGVALGGALGNLLDVLFRKGVVDYVELGVWPAFNLADVAIVTGVIVAFLSG
jgi:signal peptidase II